MISNEYSYRTANLIINNKFIDKLINNTEISITNIYGNKL